MKKLFSNPMACGVVCVSLLLLVLGAAFSYTSLARRVKAVDNATKQDALTIYAKARGKGHYSEVVPPSAISKRTGLPAIVRESDAIVFGTPRSNVCRLSRDGKSITIDYDFEVKTSFKGNLKTDDKVTVSIPGGKYTFNDGTVAEVKTPWFRKMLNDHRYILFLTYDPQSGGYTTTGGPQGLFEYGEKLKTHSGRVNDPISRYDDTDPKAFLKELRELIKGK